jgi:long-chain acyl-CoA synthetase
MWRASKGPSMQTTFPQLLLHHAAQRPQAAAMREKEYGIWQTLTWGDFATLVAQLAAGLSQRGLCAGDHMVVVGANRPRLYAVMLAAQSLGAVPVPLVPGRGWCRVRVSR